MKRSSSDPTPYLQVAKVRVEILSVVLQREPSRILDDAILQYCESLPPDDREIVRKLTERALASSESEDAVDDESSSITHSDVYVLTERAKTRRPGTVVSQIIRELTKKRRFSKSDFTEAVAVALEWDAASGKFKSDTRFPTLKLAASSWWNEFYNKLDLVASV